MDFGRDMTKTPGIVAKSNIRLVDETHLGDDPLDRELCLKANEAAKDLFFGNDYTTSKQATDNSEDEETLKLIDCSLYNEQHLPPARRLIQPNDLVVVFESFNDLNFVYATPNDIFSNRNGHFHHNDFIGKPYGCKIRSKDNEGLGFLYLLRPTPELWARSLPHRTQIVHELDASMITHYLEISPNMTVCESGTGSGAMSHVILRSIAPKGKLHTYEFNKMRVGKARKEFEGHGLGHLVQVHHRDVCGKKNLLAAKNGANSEEGIEQSAEDDALTDSATTDVDNDDMNEEEEVDDGKGGFQLGQAAAHAIFLDLPEPWLAVPHAAYTIKPNGRICSYSPCMEQTQKTVAAMKQNGFHSMRTVEARLKEYYVDEYEMETPPSDLLDIPTEEAVSLEKERQVGGTQKTKESEDKTDNDIKVNGKKRSNDSVKGPSRKILCARPFAHMRGHTAFLTFATAGNKLRPDPNASLT
ncbi:tRNA (adenine(58)-N(1))-methyltransferase catalytic subunit TRMT61A [Skeletonema marinoi]|uniref:tRNA (adenine(58)-N(1))-methyltransferase n=1 Tax=Skeletonema marinoi TaxID=267567 RepID=A0AAD9DKL7_9STRA|nr:tRNA (adenine(58)-N(1))-methyltransferase catalytic subunit TRMT61A [Skeletonema marinoi]